MLLATLPASHCVPTHQINTASTNHTLCGPNSLDSLCDTNIIRLELVQSNTNHNSSKPQSPPEQNSRLRQSLAGNIIDDDGFETDV